MKQEQLDEVIRVLHRSDGWYLWVAEYRGTHHAMNVVVHEGDFPKRYASIECGGVVAFEGVFQGGPYRLELVREEAKEGPLWTLTGSGGALKVRCATVKVLKNFLDSTPQGVAPEGTQETARDDGPKGVLATLDELLKQDSGAWENSTLSTYLEAMRAWLEAVDRRNPREVSWDLISDMLQAAKVYE